MSREQEQSEYISPSERVWLPSVTVVTVCRNALDALKPTAESVLDLEYPKMEYIIVDGASTDGTLDYLATLDKKVKWVSEPDRGIYDAMNKGVALASGDYVLFMNAGDTFCSQISLRLLGEAAAYARREDGSLPAVVYGNVCKEDRDGIRKIYTAEKPSNSHRMFFCHQCAISLRSLLIKHPFDLRHPYSADFKFFKTLIKRGAKFIHADFGIAFFDRNGVSNRRRSTALRDNISVVNETDNLFDRLRLLPHLILPYIVCRLRGK